MMYEGLCDGDSIEYFRDLMRRMHDEMCPAATYQIQKEWAAIEEALVLRLLVFGPLVVNN